MNRPLIGVGVFVYKRGRILLGKRKGAHGAGEWSLPGGHLEGGESFDDCCRREVQEETGMQIQNLAKLGFCNNVFPLEEKHYVTLFFDCETADEPTNMEPDKCEGWEWFDPSDLPEPLFEPLKDYIGEKK